MKYLGEIKELGKVNTLLRLGKETKGYLVFPNYIKFSRIFSLFAGKVAIYYRTKVFPSQRKFYIDCKFIENKRSPVTKLVFGLDGLKRQATGRQGKVSGLREIGIMYL